MTRSVRRRQGLPQESQDDRVRRVYGAFMLPDPDHSPSSSVQLRIVEPITLDVSGDLGIPVGSVGFGIRSVFRASVPKAAIDENGHFLAPKDDVCSTTQIFQRLRVDAIAKAAAMKLRSEGKLRAGVALPIAPHGRSYGGRRGRGCFGNDGGWSLGAHSIGAAF